LKVIDSDLFIGNLNLNFIAISSNKIEQVGANAFDLLANLELLYFEFNRCHSDLAKSRSKVLVMIDELGRKCNPLIKLEVKTTTPATTERDIEYVESDESHNYDYNDHDFDFDDHQHHHQHQSKNGADGKNVLRRSFNFIFIACAIFTQI
jgi:hypothetical protein